MAAVEGWRRLGWQYNCIGSKATRAATITASLIAVQNLQPRPILHGSRRRPCSSRCSAFAASATAASHSLHHRPRPLIHHTGAFKKLRPTHRDGGVRIHFIQSHANKCNLHIFQIILSGTPSTPVRVYTSVYVPTYRYIYVHIIYHKCIKNRDRVYRTRHACNGVYRDPPAAHPRASPSRPRHHLWYYIESTLLCRTAKPLLTDRCVTFSPGFRSIISYNINDCYSMCTHF